MINSIKFGTRKGRVTSHAAHTKVRASWREVKAVIDTIEANYKSIINNLNAPITDEVLIYDIGANNVEGFYFHLEFDGITWRMIMFNNGKDSSGKEWGYRIKKWTTKRERAFRIMEDYLDHNKVEN